jgi:hypothetical protein
MPRESIDSWPGRPPPFFLSGPRPTWTAADASAAGGRSHGPLHYELPVGANGLANGFANFALEACRLAADP